jgi:hypothetical protein
MRNLFCRILGILTLDLSDFNVEEVDLFTYFYFYIMISLFFK